MAVKLRIDLERINDDELARLQKRLVDLRKDAEKFGESMDLSGLAQNARASGQALKDALDLRTILQNTEKELRKQEQAILKTGDASAETARKLEELRQKQQQIAEQERYAGWRVDDAKAVIDVVNAQINATVAATKATDDKRDALERLKTAQDRLNSSSQKAVGRAGVRDIRDETPGVTGEAADRVAAERARTKEIITRIRIENAQRKKAEAELTAIVRQEVKARADAEKLARDEEKQAERDRKQAERELTALVRQEAKARAAARKKAEQDEADAATERQRKRQGEIDSSIAYVKNQRARAGQLAQRQSDTVRLENDQRALQKKIEVVGAKGATEDLRNLEQQLEEVRDKLVVNDQAMRELSKDLGLADGEIERLRQTFVNLGASQAEIDRLENAFAQLQSTLVGIDTTKTVRDSKDVAEVARQAAKALGDEEKAIRDLQRAAENSKVEANKQLVRIENLQQQREELRRMADALRDAEKPTQEMIDAAAKYERQAEDLTAQIKRLRAEQEKQAALADGNIRQANAALTNAEAQGRLAGRTEELRHTQGRLAREMNNVNFRAQRTGARELFASLGGVSDQTSKLTKEKRFLAKALIDSAQAWFLNTRASNEAFNVAQRIFSQNLKLQAGIIGVVAGLASFVGVTKLSGVVLKEQAKRSEDAARRLREQETATDDLRIALIKLGSTEYGREASTLLTDVQHKLALLMNDLAEGELGDGAHRRSGGNAIRDFLLDFPLLLDNANRGLDDFRGAFPIMDTALDLVDGLNSKAKEYANNIRRQHNQSKQAAEQEERRLLNQKAIEDAVSQSQMRSSEQSRNIARALETAELDLAETYREVHRLRVGYEEEMQRLLNSSSDKDRRRVEDLKNLQVSALQKEAELRSQIVKLQHESVRLNAELRAEIDAGRQGDNRRDPDQGLKNTLRELEALGRPLAEQDRVRAELAARLAQEQAEVTAAIERQFDALETIRENAAEGEDTSKREAAVRAEIAELREREAALAEQVKQNEQEAFERSLQRKVEIKAALDAIREQRKELLALADLERTNAQMRIANETQIDELQKARQTAQEKFGADSEQALKATRDLMEEYGEEIEKASADAQRMLERITQMEEQGNGNTDAAQAMRDKYREVLDVVRTLSDELLGLKVSAPNDVAKAEADQVKARIAAIEAAFGQMQEQGLATPADGIRNQISEADVNREVQRKRAAEFDKTIQQEMPKIIEELGAKFGRDPTTKEVNREVERRRRGFMRGQVSDQERTDARRDLSARMIDSLESQKAIGKETAEALRNQLDTETKSLNAQIETRDAIKELKSALAGETPAKPGEEPTALADAKAKRAAAREEANRERAATAAREEAEAAAKEAADRRLFLGPQWPADDQSGSFWGPQQSIEAAGGGRGGDGLGQGLSAMNQGVSQNVQSQQQLGEATGQAFEAMSQAFAGVANGQQQLANFLVALASQVAGQSSALQNSISQTMSRGGASLRNV